MHQDPGTTGSVQFHQETQTKLFPGNIPLVQLLVTFLPLDGAGAGARPARFQGIRRLVQGFWGASAVLRFTHSLFYLFPLRYLA